MFDLDAIRIAYDPYSRTVWGLAETMYALRTGTSVVEHRYKMLKPTLDRIDKYRKRGFSTRYCKSPLWHMFANMHLELAPANTIDSVNTAQRSMASLLSDVIPDETTRAEVANEESLRQSEEDYPVWLGKI